MKLTKITGDYVHEGQKYYKGETRMLSDTEAGILAASGCIEGTTPPADPKPVTLDVRNAQVGAESTEPT